MCQIHLFVIFIRYFQDMYINQRHRHVCFLLPLCILWEFMQTLPIAQKSRTFCVSTWTPLVSHSRQLCFTCCQEFSWDTSSLTSPSCGLFHHFVQGSVGVIVELIDCATEQDFLCQHIDTVGKRPNFGF